jgi:hypothetical protein
MSHHGFFPGHLFNNPAIGDTPREGFTQKALLCYNEMVVSRWQILKPVQII